jgi:hypothetical protein
VGKGCSESKKSAVNTRISSSFMRVVKAVTLTRVNSTNVLDEGLRIGEIGHQMNLKVKSVKQGVYQK